jgi:hypothetical protein
MSHLAGGTALVAALAIAAPVWGQTLTTAPPAPVAIQPSAPPPSAAATSGSPATAQRGVVHRATRRYRGGPSSDHVANELNAQELGRISSGAFAPQTYPAQGYGYPYYGYPSAGYAYPYYGYPAVGWGWGRPWGWGW